MSHNCSSLNVRSVDEKVSRMFRLCDSWGVSSVRSCAGFSSKPKESKLFDCPLGPCIVRWDFTSKSRKIFMQSTKDLITVFLLSPTGKIVLTTSYSGEIVIYNREYEVLLHGLQVPTSNVIYGCWSDNGTHFMVCSKGPSALIIAYAISEGVDGHIRLREDWRKMAPQESANELKSNKDKTYNCFDMANFTEDGSYLLAVYQQSEKNSEMWQFHAAGEHKGELSQKKVISAFDDDEIANVLFMTKCKNGIFALGLSRGMFLLMNSESLDKMSVIQAPGSPQVCLWDGDMLMTIGYVSNKVTWWDAKGVMVSESDTGPADSVIFVAWEDPGVSLWIGGIYTMHYAEIYQTEKGPELVLMDTLKYHELSGCGVDMDDNGQVVSGDLAGNVFQWRKKSEAFDNHCRIEASVRCLTAFSSGYFIGDLNGDLHCWKTNTLKSKPDLMWSFGNSVMNMKISSDNSQLLVGTGSGKVFIFKIKVDADLISLVKTLEILTHEPQMNFDHTRGWENRPMEVWSVCWSPNEEMFASASEDHTTNLWQIKTSKKLTTLTGHTTAVTSVDWKVLAGSNETLLATCADDRTIRLYDGVTYKLQRIVNVDHIYGWYTLTYLAIDPNKCLVYCVTQNGYAVVWSCKDNIMKSCHRVHSGSIEGLAMSNDFNQFCTIGSDCVANCLSFIEQ